MRPDRGWACRGYHGYLAVMAGMTAAVLMTACCVGLPGQGQRPTATAPPYQASVTATYSTAEPVHEWLVDMTYPPGLPDGEPDGKLTVSTPEPTINRDQFLHVSILPQDPLTLTRSVLDVGERISSPSDESSDVPASVVARNLAACDGCTRQVLVASELLNRHPDEPLGTTLSLELEADLERPSGAPTAPRPKLTIHPVKPVRSDIDHATSEAQTVGDVKPTVPQVRYVSADVSGPALLRVSTDDLDVDVTMIGAPSGTRAGTSGTSGTSRTTPRRTATTTFASDERAVVSAVPAGTWLVIGNDCSGPCRAGAFVVVTPQHDLPTNDDARSRSIRFTAEVAGGSGEPPVIVTPTASGDSVERHLSKGHEEGSWELVTSGATTSLVLAGLFYGDGSSTVRGNIQRRPYEISASALDAATPVGRPCPGRCDATVRYSADATGPMTVTLWAGVHSVDPADPRREAEGATVTRR